MSISAAAVKTLRDRTNAPMMDCKAALTEAGGDMDKAIEILRKKNAGIQAKKGDRETAEGRIGLYLSDDGKLGALIEMRCESAPVAKSEHFVALANDLARQVALKNPATVEELLAQPFIDDPSRTVNDRIGEVVGLIRENMKPARFVRVEGLVGAYVHHDGAVGVMVQAEGAKSDPAVLRDVAMHITAKTPNYARREEVPAAILDQEREIARSQIAADPKNASKPANIIDKIIEGKLRTWFGENVLLEQPFVKEESKTVGQLLDAAGLKFVKFFRLRVGELS